MPGPSIPIPKFASFKPKAKLKGPVKPEDEHTPTKRSREDTKHHKNKPRPEKELRHASPISKDVPLWVVDRKGDVKNLVYGSIHSYDIPTFHRAGRGGVIGATPGLKIDRNSTDDKSITLASIQDLNFAGRERNIFFRLDREQPRILKIKPQLVSEASQQSPSEVDFVPLTSKAQKRKRDDTDDSSDSETNYRSVHRQTNSFSRPGDTTLQFATESESSGSERPTTTHASLDKITILLSKQVENSPHDIDAWLALIEQQGSRYVKDYRRPATNAEIMSTADIKIHMYEKALEHARSLADRERLLLGLMAEGSKIWEIKEQASRWERITTDHIESLRLWRSYADFKQATFSVFRQEEVRDVFTQRIRLLLKAIGTATAVARESLYIQLLYVFLRLTVFMRQSGYSELAIALWQGVLEFNLFAPISMTSDEEKFSSFKEFWESEVPRIGEVGACGWRHFAINTKCVDTAPVLVDNVHDSLDNKHPFESWAKAEYLRARASLTPGRTMDEVVEDDPFRMILFSDIEELLLPINSPSKNMSVSLISAFLIFCNQPPLKNSDMDIFALSTDNFISTELLNADPTWLRREYLSTSPIVDNKEAGSKNILKAPWSHLPSSPESMFSAMWFNTLIAWQDVYPHDTGPVTHNLLRNALKQLVEVDVVEELSMYYLAFEWKNSPETIRKTAKGLLKQHPASLRLYNAYGMIEWSRGNKDVAKSVYSAALNMRDSLPQDEWKDSITLWKNWTWLSLDDFDNDTAMGRLLSIADCNTSGFPSASPAGIIKTRQHLSSNRDFFVSAGDLDQAILYAECLSLLEYLAPRSLGGTTWGNQGDINAAVSVSLDFSRSLLERKIGGTTPHMLFLQSTARLLYHHTRAGPFRPAFIRGHLTSSIEIFPQNLIFLSLYAFNEARLRIENRVRNLFISTILTPENDTLASRLFVIRHESQHGTIHSVRSAFENALASASSKSSAGLWKLYIIFCVQTPQFRYLAKDVWFRALKACPWAKELYILGFENLHDLIKFDQLKETWRVMGEKELRVHVDLEDVFDEMRELDNHE